MITAPDIARLHPEAPARTTEIFLGRAKLETFMRDRAAMDRAVSNCYDPAVQDAYDNLRRWLDCINPKTGLDEVTGVGV